MNCRLRSSLIRLTLGLALTLAPSLPSARAAKPPSETGDAFVLSQTLANAAVKKMPGWVHGILVPSRTSLDGLQIAAFAYHLLGKTKARTIILLYTAPPLEAGGIILPQSTSLQTPAGLLQVDAVLRDQLLLNPKVRVSDDTHHWSETARWHLTFIRKMQGKAKRQVLPMGLALGDVEAAKLLAVDLVRALQNLGYDKKQVFIVSAADLSRGFDRNRALAVDGKTLTFLESMAANDVVRHMEESADMGPLASVFPDWAPLLAGTFLLNEFLVNRGQALVYGNSAQFPTAPRQETTKSTGLGAVAFFSGPAAEIEVSKDRTRKLVKQVPDTALVELVRQARMSVNIAMDPTSETLRPLTEKAVRRWHPVFVTFFKDSEVVRRSGGLKAQGPLEGAVKFHAVEAALRDPRQPPLKKEEAATLTLGLDIPSGVEPVRPEDVIPNLDGVVMEYKNRRSLILPDAWKKTPNPVLLFSELAAQAGLDPWRWTSPDAHFQAFQVLSLREGESKGQVIKPETPAKQEAPPPPPADSEYR